MLLKNATAALILCGLAACGGRTKTATGSALPVGSVAINPSSGMRFLVDSNQGGAATRLDMVGQPVWGRLVDVLATDPGTAQPAVYFSDFLIGQEIQSDGIDYLLERNPVTAKETLTILHTFGTAAYDGAFARLDDGLQPFLDRSLEPDELPPYTALPRNAAMMLRFNDLLDDGGNPSNPGYPGTVRSGNVQVSIGYPPIDPGGARILPDPNHGDLVGNVFHSTRVLIDMSVSQAEAVQMGLPQNSIGLPEAASVLEPNVAVRIPTLVNAGATQFQVLTNLSGSELGYTSNGSNDPFSATRDVVRAFRSGGRTSITGDPFNGFLRDFEPPQVLGSQPVTVTLVQPFGAEFLVDLQFATSACATQPRTGDVLVLPSVVAEVTQVGPLPVAGLVSGVQMKLIAGAAANFVPGSGDFDMPWDPALGVVPECFVRFQPEPLQPPNMLVSNNASVLVTFSEPVFPTSTNGFSGMRVGYTPVPANPMNALVVGTTEANQDLTEFQFDPSTRLNHVQGGNETFSFDLGAGATGVVDLAGNPLGTPLPQTMFTLDDLEATVSSGSIGLQFSDSTLDENGDGNPEIRGQFVAKPITGEITARSPERFSAVVDDSQYTVSQMSSVFFTLAPVVTDVPLTPNGARLQTTWRSVDLGLPMVDVGVIPDPMNPGSFLYTVQGWASADFNLDVEGLAWAPSFGGLAIDNFPEFKLGLTHGSWLPDETIGPVSGLGASFAGNELTNHPTEIVHQRAEGYLVQPVDLFKASTGTSMAPWPLNRNKPVSAYKYFTWRDTSIQEVGGAGSSGADPAIWWNTGFGFTPPGAIYAGGNVPTIGLPLLMDMSIYPSNAGGLNLLAGRVTLLNTPTGFRAYSSGFYNPSGPPTSVNPDQETQAVGTIVNGASVLGVDDLFYLGQADFVKRVNQVHTAWLDAGVNSNWQPAVFDPPPLEQPDGTSVSVAYRGAVGITGKAVDIANARLLDPYGDVLDLLGLAATPNPNPPVVTFLNGDNTWHTDISDLDGARYVQARITMVSNVESGVSPTISAFGLTFEN